MNFIALNSVERAPWANGGGFKRNLLKTTQVQISVAEITRDGPFSMLPDQQRFFAVLAGKGVRLGLPEQFLTQESVVYEFAGEDAPACYLIDGPTEDLNLMVQRSTTKGTMRRECASREGITTNFAAGRGIVAAYVCGPASIVSKTAPTHAPFRTDQAGLLWQAASQAPEQWLIRPADDAQALLVYLIEALDL